LLARFRSSLIWQLIAVLVLLFALSAGVFVLLASAISKQRDAASDAANAERSVAAAGALEARLIDLETGARGFLIGGKERFLRPYRAALRQYPSASDRLLGSTSTPETRSMAEAITRRIDAYAKGYIEPLVKTARRNIGAAGAIVRAGEGQRRVSDLRGRFQELAER
jgi:CHASE3 domain sensor protein